MSRSERAFRAWHEQQDREMYLSEQPECPDCGLVMKFEMKDARHMNRKQDGYYLRRCHPCGKIWQLVRGEFKEWTPQRDPL